MIAGLSLVQLAIAIIVIAGIIGIVMVVLRQMNVAVPKFIVNILWIIFAVVIGVVAIKVLVSLL